MMMAAETRCKKHLGQELHKTREAKIACEGVMRGVRARNWGAIEFESA